MHDPARRRSPLRRFAFDRDGHLRSWRLLGLSAAVALTLTIGGLAAAVLAGTGSPEALAIWATVAFVGIKLPILGLLWWLLGRSEHTHEDASLTDETAAAALRRLRQSADRAAGAADAWDRFDNLAAEAAFIAAHASADLAGDANVLRVDLISARDRAAESAAP